MHEYTEQIQRWEDQLKAGDWVRCGPSELDKAIIVSLARGLIAPEQETRIYGVPLFNDSLGQRAKALIDV